MADKIVTRWFGGPLPQDVFEKYKRFQSEHGYKSQAELVMAAMDCLMASPPPAPKKPTEKTKE